MLHARITLVQTLAKGVCQGRRPRTLCMGGKNPGGFEAAHCVLFDMSRLSRAASAYNSMTRKRMVRTRCGGSMSGHGPPPQHPPLSTSEGQANNRALCFRGHRCASFFVRGRVDASARLEPPC